MANEKTILGWNAQVSHSRPVTVKKCCMIGIQPLDINFLTCSDCNCCCWYDSSCSDSSELEVDCMLQNG